MNRSILLLLILPLIALSQAPNDDISHHVSYETARQQCLAYNTLYSSCARIDSPFTAWVVIRVQTGASTFFYSQYEMRTECELEGWSCTRRIFRYSLDGTCPSGTEPDSNGQCLPPEDICEPGSLSPSCRVDCPSLEYTYYLDGVLRQGKTAQGSVGHGQSCPSPIFPEGHATGCVGTPGMCQEWGQGIDERIPVTVIEETVTENEDGSTTTETTSKTSGGSSSGGGANPGGSDVRTATGSNVDPDANYADTVNVGDTTYARCEHGGLMDSTVWCDYVPPSCPAGQIPTITGCIAPPQDEPPPTNIPPKRTETKNPDGSSTTVEHGGSDSATGTGGGGGGGQPGQGDQKPSTGSSSATCASPPQSTGDAQLNAILLQQWNMMCLGEFEKPTTSPSFDQKRTELEGELSEKFGDIKDEITNLFDFNAPSGGCINNPVQIRGVTIDFSVCRFISLFQAIGTLLVGICALSAVAIVTRSN